MTGMGFNYGNTPYDAFCFVGDGPYYEFQVAEQGAPFSVVEALNYFERIGATVIGRERRSFQPEGFPVDTFYCWYLVRWDGADVEGDPHA